MYLYSCACSLVRNLSDTLTDLLVHWSISPPCFPSRNKLKKLKKKKKSNTFILKSLSADIRRWRHQGVFPGLLYWLVSLHPHTHTHTHRPQDVNQLSEVFSVELTEEFQEADSWERRGVSHEGSLDSHSFYLVLTRFIQQFFGCLLGSLRAGAMLLDGAFRAPLLPPHLPLLLLLAVMSGASAVIGE